MAESRKRNFVVVYMIYSVEGLAASELMLGKDAHFVLMFGEKITGYSTAVVRTRVCSCQWFCRYKREDSS